MRQLSDAYAPVVIKIEYFQHVAALRSSGLYIYYVFYCRNYRSGIADWNTNSLIKLEVVDKIWKSMQMEVGGLISS